MGQGESKANATSTCTLYSGDLLIACMQIIYICDQVYNRLLFNKQIYKKR